MNRGSGTCRRVSDKQCNTCVIWVPERVDSEDVKKKNLKQQWSSIPDFKKMTYKSKKLKSKDKENPTLERQSLTTQH